MAELRRLALAAATLALWGPGAGCAHAPAGPEPAGDGLTRIECGGGAGDEVRVVGSFDGWRRAWAATRGEDGRFSVRLRLPPGASAVSCLRRLPGGALESSAPLNAPRVEQDGFGARNGIFGVDAAGKPDAAPNLRNGRPEGE